MFNCTRTHLYIDISTYLEGDLSNERKLILLKQTAVDIHEDGVGYFINKVVHSLFHIICWLSLENCCLKHYIKGLKYWQKFVIV